MEVDRSCFDRRNLPPTKRSTGGENGKTQRGWPRTMMLEGMFDPTAGNQHETMKKKAQDRDEW